MPFLDLGSAWSLVEPVLDNYNDLSKVLCGEDTATDRSDHHHTFRTSCALGDLPTIAGENDCSLHPGGIWSMEGRW
jgi:hypothetical protein